MNTPLYPNAPAPQPPPLEPPLPQKMDLKTLFEALLRRPHALVERLGEPDHGATAKFAMIGLVSFLLFGFVLGCFAKNEQLWAAPVKVGAGLMFAGIICFPSLYIFATLAGARVSPSQMAASLAGALALAGLLLLGFAPAVWIFAESTDSLGFMGWLSVGAWIVALVFCLRFLKVAVFATGGTQKGPLAVWSIVFLLVTLQMTTSLRPILGRSEFFLTQDKKFFLEHWAETMGKSLSPARTAAATPQRPSEVAPARGAENPFLDKN